MFDGGRKREIAIVRDMVAAMNDHDADRVASLLGDNPRFVDSHGEWLEGRDEVIEATRRFLDMDRSFKLHIEQSTHHHGDVLLRGHVTSDQPAMATDTLWRARVKRGKLVYWQSYGSPNAPHLARMLKPMVDTRQPA